MCQTLYSAHTHLKRMDYLIKECECEVFTRLQASSTCYICDTTFLFAVLQLSAFNLFVLCLDKSLIANVFFSRAGTFFFFFLPQ